MTSLIIHHRRMLAASVLTIALSMAALDARAQSEIGETSMVVEFEVKPGSEAEFEEYFLRSAHCSRLEPGNVAFNIHRVVGEEPRYVLYEIWRSPEALNVHFERLTPRRCSRCSSGRSLDSRRIVSFAISALPRDPLRSTVIPPMSPSVAEHAIPTAMLKNHESSR